MSGFVPSPAPRRNSSSSVLAVVPAAVLAAFSFVSMVLVTVDAVPAAIAFQVFATGFLGLAVAAAWALSVVERSEVE